jgi:hypothetical protein
LLKDLDPNWTRPGRVEKLFNAIDVDNSGTIDVAEFVEWTTGQNVHVNKLKDSMSFDVLRLTGCNELAPEEILDSLSQFGTITHIHHAENASFESIVVFASQAEAIAAFSAFFPSAEEAEAELKRARDNPDDKLRLGGKLHGTSKLCFADIAPGAVFLTSAACCKSGSLRIPGSFCDEVQKAVTALGTQLEGDNSWRKRSAESYKLNTLPQAADMLRLLSLSIHDSFIEDNDDLNNWRISMRAMVQGQLDLMDPERITDLVKELLTFCWNDGCPMSPKKLVPHDRFSLPLS